MSIINFRTPCYKEEQTTQEPKQSQGTSAVGSNKTKPNLITRVNLNYLGHLVKLLLFMEVLCSVTRYCQAATIEFDWSRHNKVFREATAGGHLVRVHIGDRLEITCSHPHSVIILTDSFQDYHSCQFNHMDQTITKSSPNENKLVQSSEHTKNSRKSHISESESLIRSRRSSMNNGGRKPLWRYNCSQLYGEDMDYYRYKTQLPIYRYPSAVDQPSFQFAKPYFLIDIGVPTTPKSHLTNPTAIPDTNINIKNNENNKTFDSQVSLRSNTPTLSIRGQPVSEKLTSEREQNIKSVNSPQYLRRVTSTSSPAPNELIHQFKGQPGANYGIQMDDVNTNTPQKSSSSNKNSQIDKTIPESTSQDEGDLRSRERRKKGQQGSKQRVKGHLHGDTREAAAASGSGYSWNMCELYHMKLSLFVEFRDDNIGYGHRHLPIHEEIIAVQKALERENHLTAGSHSTNYSSTFYFKLRPQKQLEQLIQRSQSETDPDERKFLKFVQVAHPDDPVPAEGESNPSDPTTQRSSSASLSPFSRQGSSPSSSSGISSTPKTNWGPSQSTADSDLVTSRNQTGSKDPTSSRNPGANTNDSVINSNTENSSRNGSGNQSSEMYNDNTENAGNGNGENSVSATTRHENNQLWLTSSLIILIINYWC